MKLFAVLGFLGLVAGDLATGPPVLDPDDPSGDISAQTTPLCEVTNCITCFEANMCQSCEEGFSATHSEDTDGTCKKCEVDMCAICDDHAAECQQCDSGYYLVTVDGTTGAPVALDGVTAGAATTGDNGSPTQIQTCVECTITGCGECVVDSSGDETCDACAEGYYQAQDGSCSACGDNCAECAAVDSNGVVGGCLQCDDLYEPELDGSCGLIGEDCGNYCDECEEHNQCKTCQDGYSVMLFNNDLSSGCAPCPPNCASCADAETCDACEDGFTLDDVSGSCATDEQIVANVCDCRTTTNDGCTCPGDENDAKDGCCDAGGLCGGDGGVCSLYNNDVCSDFDNCAYCFGQSFCGSCDVGYYKTNGHPWGACIPLPTGWDLDACDESLLYDDQCDCGCGGVDPECVEHQVINCDTTDGGVYCDADATCAACPLDGCLYCENGESPTECHECMDGYDLNVNNTCVKCEVDGCSACSTGTVLVDNEPTTTVVCKTCMDGYYGDIASGTCTACDAENCEQCSATECNKCMDGFSLDSASGTCNTCSDNCLQCGASQCNRCESGFQIVSGACVADGDCGSNCATCQRGSQCKICEAGYYVGAGTNGKCVSCMDNCDSCRDADSCSVCADGYSFDINEGSCLVPGQCLADICDCRSDSEYAINNGCTCLEDESSAKFGCCNSDCGVCADHCADYTGEPCTDFDNCEYCFGQDYCMECADGYFQQEYHGDCIALPDGWDTDLCPVTVLNNNECDCDCGGYDPDCDEEPADGCDDYQYCSVDGVCSDCNVAGCLHCANGLEHETNEGECLECTDGHYIDDDGVCNDCNLDGCAVCLMAGDADTGSETNPTDPPVDGGDDGVTEPPAATLATLNIGEFTCKQCSDGYYMNHNDLCSECTITNCDVCSIDGDCEECANGYSLSDGTCTGCIDNCIDCTGDLDSCKRCADNYEVLEDGTCGEVDNDCGDNCYVCGAQGVCKQCMNTFYKDSDSTCVACMDNCGSCTSDSSCSECTSGYGYNNGACEAFSDALEYCDEQIKNNVFSDGTQCVCDGWECSAIEATTEVLARFRQ